MNISSTLSTSGGSSDSGSSSDGLIRAPAPIVPLRTVHDNNFLVNDISFVLKKKYVDCLYVDCLYNYYQISRELFRVFAPDSHVRVDDQISAKDTIIVYKE